MKKWKALFIKGLIGYLINTIVVSIFVLLLHYIFKLDVYDSVLICGIAILFYSFLTFKRFVRTLPATSPLGGTDTGLGDQAAHAAILNVVVAEFENRNKEEGEIVVAPSIGISYFLFKRSQFELISYAVLLVIIGLIKYYSYF